MALLRLFLPPDALKIRPCFAVSSLTEPPDKQSSDTFALEFQDGEEYISVMKPHSL